MAWGKATHNAGGGEDSPLAPYQITQQIIDIEYADKDIVWIGGGVTRSALGSPTATNTIHIPTETPVTAHIGWILTELWNCLEQ